MKPSGSSKLFNIINKIGTAMLINIMFVIGSIPLITIGASWSGLYSGIRNMIRGEDWFAGYKKGFKTGTLRNILATVYGLVLGYIALNDGFLPALHMLVAGVEVPLAITLTVAFGILLLAVLLFLTVMIPVNFYIRTDRNRWLKNTISIILHAPLQSLIATVLTWFPAYQFIFWTGDFIFLGLLYLAAYSFMAGLISTLLLKTPLSRLLDKEREAGVLLNEDDR